MQKIDKAFEQGLSSVLSEYLEVDWENDDVEPMDGDEVETLAAHLLNRLQLMNGNITEKEYQVREELGSKIFYNTPDIFFDSKDCNVLVKFESELEEGDVQFGILHGDLVICLCGCSGILEYGDYKILERFEKIDVSKLLFMHFGIAEEKITVELDYSELETLNGHLAEHLAELDLSILETECAQELQSILNKLSALMQ